MNARLPLFSCIVLFLFVNAGCKPDSKEKVYIAPPATELELVWEKMLSPDSSMVYHAPIIMFNGDLLMPNSPIADLYFVMRDGESGDEKWIWHNDDEFFMGTSPNDYMIDGNDFIGSRNGEVSSIDLLSGSVNWRHEVPSKNGLSGVSSIGGYMYCIQKSDGFPDEYQSAYMVRSLSGPPVWDTILQLQKDSLDGYTPRMSVPTLWLNPEGDSILVFQNQGYNKSTRRGQTDMYAYNLSRKKMEFSIPRLDDYKPDQVLPPLVDGDLAYILGKRELYCIDLKKQSRLWTKSLRGRLGEYLSRSNLVIKDDIIILNPNNESLYGLNKFTGSQVWKNEEAGNLPGYMSVYGEHVFYISNHSGHIMGINIKNGTTILAMKTPNTGDAISSYHTFHDYFAIEPNLGYLYASDGYFLMCFKLHN